MNGGTFENNVVSNTKGGAAILGDSAGAEITVNGGIYRNDKPLCDILTGNKYDGDIKVEPYGVLVLEE